MEVAEVTAELDKRGEAIKQDEWESEMA
jgi:hypothetical protein